MYSLFTALITAIIGATVALSWQPSQDAHTSGYRIYYDRYSSLPDSTRTLAYEGISTSVRFTHISTNRNYCFAGTVLATYSGATHESKYSNIQCGKISIHPDYSQVPNYRPDGTTPNYPPDGTLANPMPLCTACHTGGTP
jgi:hypothetical protein